MTDIAVLARARAGDGRPAERLTCHPRLPLVAATAAGSRLVRIWDFADGLLREAASFDLGLQGLGSGDPGHGDPAAQPPDDRSARWPGGCLPLAWHPEQPLLLVTDRTTLVRWTPDGPPVVEPAPAPYGSLAFSPDGGRLWASPSAGGPDTSDVLDLATGATTTARGWDTGVAAHPSGRLLATLVSDQSATFCVFARPAGGAMRQLRHTLVLDVDGYGTPLFSADGRHLAIRGNAYFDSVDVFELPSLRRVLSTSLGEPGEPGESGGSGAWPYQNLAFGAAPGVLWIGSPTGTLIELDVTARSAVEHDPLPGSPLAALAATATGHLLAARTDGELILLSVRSAPAPAPAVLGDEATAFLASTADVPEDGDLEPHLVITDGSGSWSRGDLTALTEAATTDPAWLDLRAAVDRAPAG
ncbi:TolB family protein [Kitasatospora sp. NPDC056327]|uniref:TolB family protein n=1 Tax=Kitasatospora sp. NPDC056327 TaxID=3345785 RepID=UPI0035DF4A35